MNRPALALAAAVALVALTSCSSADDTTEAASTAGAEPVADTGTGDVDATCAGLTDLAAALVSYPGADPDGPPASAADLQSWEAGVRPVYDGLVASAPQDLTSALDELGSILDGVAQGTPIDDSDPAVASSSAQVDQWGYDSCDYPALDVSNDGTALQGVPATLPAGPLRVSFTNTVGPDQAGFVLLVVRLQDGADITAAQVADGSADFEPAISSLAVAQPADPTSTGYTLTTLTPGRYLVVCPLGAPPEFGATLAGEFTVG